MPDLLERGSRLPGAGRGVQGGAGPRRRAVRCLSSVSLLSVEDTGRGSTCDWGLASRRGLGGSARGRLFCFGPASQPLLTEAVSLGCRAVLLSCPQEPSLGQRLV